MRLLKTFFQNFPAASRALLLAMSVSLLVWIGLYWHFHENKPTIFVLGDSGIGNYRLDPGDRFQDILEKMNPGISVNNWAQPGATPMDFLLQYTRGKLLAGKPQRVVIAFSPDKFLEDAIPHRFDDDGANLRYIPWNQTGWELFTRLSLKEKNAAIVGQSSLFFYAATDLGKALWIRYVQWPWERSQMRTATCERRKRIERKSLECGRELDTLKMVDDKAYEELPLAEDAEFLLTVLKSEGVETHVILLPISNPHLIHKTYSLRAQANQDTLTVRMRHWLENLGQPYVDFNAPQEITHFPDSTWDDMTHLKSPLVFAHMSQRLERAWHASPNHVIQQRFSALGKDESHEFLDARY